MMTFNKFRAYVVGFVLAPLARYVSSLMLGDIPEQGDLSRMTSEDVVKVEYLEATAGKERLRICDRSDICVSIPSNASGYDDLAEAIQRDKKYSIGYNAEHQLSSDRSTLFTVVYAISIDGNDVVSFADKVRCFRWAMYFIAGVGFMLIAASVYVISRENRKN